MLSFVAVINYVFPLIVYLLFVKQHVLNVILDTKQYKKYTHLFLGRSRKMLGVYQ